MALYYHLYVKEYGGIELSSFLSACHEGGHQFKTLNASESPGGDIGIGKFQQSLLGPIPSPSPNGDERFQPVALCFGYSR